MASTEHFETGQVGAKDHSVRSAPVGVDPAHGHGKS
jgi:hypothetical protein